MPEDIYADLRDDACAWLAAHEQNARGIDGPLVRACRCCRWHFFQWKNEKNIVMSVDELRQRLSERHILIRNFGPVARGRMLALIDGREPVPAREIIEQNEVQRLTAKNDVLRRKIVRLKALLREALDLLNESDPNA